MPHPTHQLICKSPHSHSTNSPSMRVAAGRLAFLHASRLVQGGRGSIAGLASITAAAWASPSCSPSTSPSTRTPGVSSCESRPQHSSRSLSKLTMSSGVDQASSSVASGAVDLSDITGYLNAEDSAALDAELMSTPGFSLEQLMELAGLAVAEAVYAVVPPDGKERKKILLVCGPGNNGGDGLVAARHLTLFGYDCTVVYPKQSKKQHFLNLVKQMEDVGVKVLEEMPADAKEGQYAAIVDAIFGFSFQGEGGIREPFGSIIKDMIASQGKGDGAGTSIISVDVPSGWDVNGGDGGTGFMPDVLISLTSPKLSSKRFTGRHFVGGRFLPPAVAEKYGVSMPPYQGVQQVMEIKGKMVQNRQKSTQDASDKGWEEEYYAYLAEKEVKAAVGEKDDADGKKGVQSSDDDVEDWALQYQEYCIEKEKALDEAEKKKKLRVQHEGE